MGNSVLLVLGLFFSLVALQNLGCLTGRVVRITSQPPVQGHQCKPRNTTCQLWDLPLQQASCWFPATQTPCAEQHFLGLSIPAQHLLVQCSGNRALTLVPMTHMVLWFCVVCPAHGARWSNTARRQSLSYTTAQPNHWEVLSSILRGTYFIVGYSVPESLFSSKMVFTSKLNIMQKFVKINM